MLGYPKEILSLRCPELLRIVFELSQIKPEGFDGFNASHLFQRAAL